MKYYSTLNLKYSSIKPFGDALNQLLFSIDRKTLNQFGNIALNTLLFGELEANKSKSMQNCIPAKQDYTNDSTLIRIVPSGTRKQFVYSQERFNQNGITYLPAGNNYNPCGDAITLCGRFWEENSRELGNFQNSLTSRSPRTGQDPRKSAFFIWRLRCSICS